MAFGLQIREIISTKYSQRAICENVDPPNLSTMQYKSLPLVFMQTIMLSYPES